MALFSTYDSTCQIAQEIAEKIQQRNQYERRGEKTTKLTVTIRALLQNLKEKIALLKDLLLRAVSTHQIFSPQLEGDLVSKILPVILISIFKASVPCFTANVLAKQDLPKEFSRLGGTFPQHRRLGLCLGAVCTELCPVWPAAGLQQEKPPRSPCSPQSCP
uniref:Uncharacterized protein n=1 Tax=Oryctolagus cuniculus TaxID=9986 RepID=A0A5F9C9S3_RABIT